MGNNISRFEATIRIAYDGELTRNIDKFVHRLDINLRNSGIEFKSFALDAVYDKSGVRIITQSGAEGNEDCNACPEEAEAKQALQAVARPNPKQRMSEGTVSIFDGAGVPLSTS
jgi:hypothetical protein